MNVHVQEPWMQTYSGKRFLPLNPTVEMISILDIAAALGKMCRYNGHCLEFYSVAEHCVHVSRYVPVEMRLTALLHDAQEVYLADIVRPMKACLAGYAEMEDKYARLIAEKFGTIYPLPPEVKRADNAILSDERRQNMMPMKVSDAEWGNTEPELGVGLRLWAPSRARDEFMQAFRAYGGVE
jgi:hypothetical protein